MNESMSGKGDYSVHQPPIDVKSIRESKGLMLKDISDLTRISIVHLESIENETFDLLPPPVYSKSFIKKYEEAIGIEGNVILKHYEDFLEKTQKIYPEQHQHGASAGSGKKRYMIIGIFTVLIIGTLAVFFTSPSNRNADEKIPVADLPLVEKADNLKPEKNDGLAPKESISDMDSVKGDKPNTQQKNQSAKATPRLHAANDVNRSVEEVPQPLIASNDHQPVQEEAQNPPGPNEKNSDTFAITKPYILTVEARELTWIRITGDEEDEPYDVMLRPGDKVMRTATRGFLIDCGNAGGIDITFQGKSLGHLGEPGDVVHLRLP